jgi:uncharacterized Zn finger protein
MKCPGCGSGQVRKRRRDVLFRCKVCGMYFTENEVRREKVKTQSGSGTVAGKILIGRGTRWGAGW